MQKKWMIIVALAVVAVVFAGAGLVYAQAPTPNTPNDAQDWGYRRGGMMGGNGMARGAAAGPMHDEMVAVFAEKLGLDVEVINTRLTAGETMLQIAESEGVTGDEFTALMLDARTAALDKAVANGDITQEQADWMKSRWQQGAANGAFGGCMSGDATQRGGRGMMGGGRGGRW